MICLLGGATSSLDLCGLTGGLRPASPQYVSHLLAPSTSNNYIQAQLTADTSEFGVMYLCWQCSGSTVISIQSTQAQHTQQLCSDHHATLYWQGATQGPLGKHQDAAAHPPYMHRPSTATHRGISAATIWIGARIFLSSLHPSSRVT